MQTFSSLKGLNEYIQKQINDTLKNEVFETVREVELEHIENDVLAIYEPNQYLRRDSRGINDPQNIIFSSLKDGILEIENITKFNPDYETANTGYGLVGLIEFGDKWNGFRYEYPHIGGISPYNRSRPFIANTKTELKKEKQHISALKVGLNKRGIKTT